MTEESEYTQNYMGFRLEKFSGEEWRAIIGGYPVFGSYAEVVEAIDSYLLKLDY